MNVGLFDFTNELYGGSAYQKMVAEALSSQYAVRQFDVKKRLFIKGERPQAFLLMFLKQMEPKIDLWIRNNIAVAAMTKWSLKKKNIALCHHIEGLGIGNYWFGRAYAELFLKNVRKCDRVVVVAEFWKKYLESEGVERITVIHNAFDTDAFAVKEEQVHKFKIKYGLLEKPVFYIGNCREDKGSAEVYEALKSLDVHLVSSGVRTINLPVRTFELTYSEYILLLSACDVVITMSKFLEGWNRVAHEAMLCKTPVIGSGSGGMGELLEGGNQIICKNIQDLRKHVNFALDNAVPLGDKGYRFASQFTKQRFIDSWISLIETYAGPSE